MLRCISTFPCHRQGDIFYFPVFAVNSNTVILSPVELLGFHAGRRVLLNSLYASLKVILNLADLEDL